MGPGDRLEGLGKREEARAWPAEKEKERRDSLATGKRVSDMRAAHTSTISPSFPQKSALV